jgi:type II secretory pathway component PulF
MPTFTYRAAQGGATGTVEAVDRASAVREVLRRGLTPVAVEESGGASLAGVSRAVLGENSGSAGFSLGGVAGVTGSVMSRAEMASFVRELATAIMAGLPLVTALKTLARSGRSAKQKTMLESLISQVEGGTSLGDAMASWGRPFDQLTTSITRAGEASGKLAEVLEQAADLLDRDLRLRRSIVGATLYPMILLLLIGAAVVVITAFIVPTILDQMDIPESSLPFPTRVVKGVADTVQAVFIERWYVSVPLSAMAVIGLLRLWADPAFVLWKDTMILRTPVLGRLARDVAVSRFARTLGTLTKAGVPILQSLRITKGVLGNKAMEGVIDQVVDQVAGGATIADPMEKSGQFPPMLVQIVNLGERSGRLDQMLTQASRAFDERVDQSIKLFTTALPPVLIVIMAGVVGFVVLAVFLALLEAQDQMAGAG